MSNSFPRAPQTATDIRSGRPAAVLIYKSPFRLSIGNRLKIQRLFICNNLMTLALVVRSFSSAHYNLWPSVCPVIRQRNRTAKQIRGNLWWEDPTQYERNHNASNTAMTLRPQITEPYNVYSSAHNFTDVALPKIFLSGRTQ
jgi:hypothetical protein